MKTKIQIVEYNPEWKAVFDRLKAIYENSKVIQKLGELGYFHSRYDLIIFNNWQNQMRWILGIMEYSLISFNKITI